MGATIDGVNFGNRHELRGDLDASCTVDLVDLGLLCDSYLAGGAVVGDIAPWPEGDGVVNLLDYGVLVQFWLTD